MAKAIAHDLAQATGRRVPMYVFSSAELLAVGAVKSIFERLRQERCLIVLDEVDAIANRVSSEDTTRATIELCIQLDGLRDLSGPLVIAATASEPDRLDASVRRRFTTRVRLDLPNEDERLALFELYLSRVRLVHEPDARDLAARSQGFTGADIAGAVASGLNLSLADSLHGLGEKQLLEAVDRRGISIPSISHDPRSAWLVAAHEAGHAVAAWLTFGAEALNRVSIEPWPGLGDGHFSTSENWQLNRVANELDWRGEIVVLMGGMAGEQLLIGYRSVGSESDVRQITRRLWRYQSTGWHPHGTYSNSTLEDEEGSRAGLKGSEAMRAAQWQAIKEEADDCYARTVALLKPHTRAMTAFVRRLVEVKSLAGDELVGALEEYLPEAVPLAASFSQENGSNLGAVGAGDGLGEPVHTSGTAGSAPRPAAQPLRTAGLTARERRARVS